MDYSYGPQTMSQENVQYLLMQNIYDASFNLELIPEEQRALMKQHVVFSTFPVWLAVILHFITFGIFTIIYMGVQHAKFPRIKSDDFGAGKAIGFLFIPFFNLYWQFIFWLRLADRINLQYRLRNRPPAISKGLVLATVIVLVIPYVNYIAMLILLPILSGMIQSALNGLARETQGGPVTY